MNWELEYRFHELELFDEFEKSLGLFVDGRANFQYDSSGDWQLGNVIATRIEDRDGNNVMDKERISDATLRDAIISRYSGRIEDLIMEELIWNSDESDRGCYEYHQKTG